jgi:hypothetical protein
MYNVYIKKHAVRGSYKKHDRRWLYMVVRKLRILALVILIPTITVKNTVCGMTWHRFAVGLYSLHAAITAPIALAYGLYAEKNNDVNKKLVVGTIITLIPCVIFLTSGKCKECKR